MIQLLAKSLSTLPSVTSMLGVGTYSATKIVDAIFLGAGIFKIFGLLLGCGVSISFGLLMVKRLTKAIGRAAAISW